MIRRNDTFQRVGWFLRLFLVLAAAGSFFLASRGAEKTGSIKDRVEKEVRDEVEHYADKIENTVDEMRKETPGWGRLEAKVGDEVRAAEVGIEREAGILQEKGRQAETRLGASIKNPEDVLAYLLEGRETVDPATSASAAHHELLVREKFPSASQCATCHPRQYREWSVSSHAYSQISPIFNAMHATVGVVTNGTNGDFCIRCHNRVGMETNEPLFTSNKERSAVAREGITCIVCHRVKESYGRVSGRMGLELGDISKPMYGPRDNKVLQEVLGRFNVSDESDSKDGAPQIHSGAVKIETFASPQLCAACHDVNSQNHFRLEEAYSQFRNTEIAAQGTRCQDCHMGKVQGIPSEYEHIPLAHIGGVPTPAGPHANHMFAGPDYSVVHPGIFPHNPLADKIATFEEWLQFDVEAGWGTETFENNLPEEIVFPEAWKNLRHRVIARAFVDEQLQLIGEIRAQSFRVLRRAYQLGGFEVTRHDNDGIDFRIQIRNGTGDGAPTGFDAERLVFLQVTVTDAAGKTVFVSGDRDPNGDVRDLHSAYVRSGEMPLDPFLMSLQSRFLIDYLRGGEREEILPVNQSADPLPFVRPSPDSALLRTYPLGVRKQARGIPPYGVRWAKYEMDPASLGGRAPYTVNLKYIAQMVPINLVNAISGVGFDYGLSRREIAERVINSAFLLWDETFPLPAAGQTIDLRPTEEEILGSESVKPALPWLRDESSDQ